MDNSDPWDPIGDRFADVAALAAGIGALALAMAPAFAIFVRIL